MEKIATLKETQLHELRRLLVDIVRFNLPPVWDVATVAAVELRRNVIVTSRAPKSMVLFGFHCFLLSISNLFV
jgi:hypothetical protein